MWKLSEAVSFRFFSKSPTWHVGILDVHFSSRYREGACHRRVLRPASGGEGKVEG